MTHDPASQTQSDQLAQTTLAKPWLSRMIILLIVLLGFGTWALYDAAVKYPAKGREVTQGFELEYLKQAKSSGRLFDTSVPDPKGRLAELRKKDLLELSEFDRKQKEWLESLAIPGLGMLNADHTVFRDAQQRLDDLSEKFKTRPNMAKLSTYDILMQWIILVLCWGLALIIFVWMVLVASKKYRWNQQALVLILPNGTEIKPSDLDSDDPANLTKWHKFIVFLNPASGSSLGRKPIKLDLFRYEPLEAWVIELVKAADPDFTFPNEEQDDETHDDDAEDEDASSGTDEQS